MRLSISYVLMFLGILFLIAGTFGLFRYRNFFCRILLSSQIDTIGFLTVMAGIIIRSGIGFFSAKILIICLLGLIISPLNTHVIARSAYQSGYRSEKEDNDAP